jgi:hypothetical protein
LCGCGENESGVEHANQAESPTATAFYVAPNGSSSANGSISSPWDLQTALNHPASVAPGDTIWLRGGVYPGKFDAQLTGTAAAPITVRQYPGERATIDANSASYGVALSIKYAAHARFWGFEVTSSVPDRTPNTNGPNFPEGVDIYESEDIKLINLVVHDMFGQGIAAWAENVDAEVYGNIVYNNGQNHWDHSLYMQNETGTKSIRENLLMNPASHNVHLYGSTEAYLNNFVFNIKPRRAAPPR